MKRIEFEVRQDLDSVAAECDFTIVCIDNEPYWDETHAYEFGPSQIENDIEDPTNQLMQMCYDTVEQIVTHDAKFWLPKMDIPVEFHAPICDSWFQQARDLYGRMDFSYDGVSPAKLLEFNADTPTSLFESSVFQWRWLQDMIARGTLREQDVDQFNSIQERLIEAFGLLSNREKGHEQFHFLGCLDIEEEKITLGYLADCAAQAGLNINVMDIRDVGVTAEGQFTDLDDTVITDVFKLYPIEDMMREQFAPQLAKNPWHMYEPLWKSIMTNKGFMAALWHYYPNHPNLLECYLSDEPRFLSDEGGWAIKPLWSREGEGVMLFQDGAILDSAATDPCTKREVAQRLHKLPQFGQDFPVIGSWIVAGQACAMGIREDRSLITKNTSRFVPHYIKG